MKWTADKLFDIKKFLVDNGYEGLVCNELECACGVDIICDRGCPCGEGPFEDCEPGHKIPCDCGEHDYHILEGKKKTEVEYDLNVTEAGAVKAMEFRNRMDGNRIDGRKLPYRIS